MQHTAQFHVFTPQRDRPEELEKILVKRHALLASAVDKMRESIVTKDKHRLLFIGPRGMGKSYLVTLIHHRLSIQEDLAGKTRFAWLNEDQTSTTFLHLLSRIYGKLAEQYPGEFPAGELETIRGKDLVDAREMLQNSLLRHLQDRTVVLLVENIDAIFGAMGEGEQRIWRGFLQDHRRFAIVATAQGLTADISSKTRPFYGFFETHHLDPLTVDEAAELLGKIADINGNEPLAKFIASPTGKARMRAIHHLSGGNPRLYLILSDFLTKESLDNLVRLFEETVDRQLTPYFQERMRWISPQQQEIVQFLCKRVHPANVKEIAEGIFAKQNTASSQLKQLRGKGYLVSKGRGKESLYELTEPLMRLSFQVKEMNNRQPLALIVDFMRVWYDRNDLERRLAGIVPGTLGRDYFEVALHKIDTEGNAFRHSLMLAGLENIDWDHCDPGQLEELRGIAEETNDPKAWQKYALKISDVDHSEEAIRALSRAINLSDRSSTEYLLGLLTRARCHFNLGHFAETIADCSACVEFPGASERVRRTVLYCRAKAWLALGDKQASVGDFSKVIEAPNVDAKIFAFASLERGNIYGASGQTNKAITDYTRVIDLPDPPLESLGAALVGRAQMFSVLDKWDETMVDSERALSFVEMPAEILAFAMVARGSCHFRLGHFDKAMADLETVINSSDAKSDVSACALYLSAQILLHSGDFGEGINRLLKLAQTHDTFTSASLLHLSKAYRDLRQYKDSLRSILSLLGREKFSSAEDLMPGFEIGPIFVDAVFGLTEDPSKRMDAARQILRLLQKHELLTGISTALVGHMEKLKTSDLNNAALDRWVSDWESVGRDYPEMQVAIRMLSAGVNWIKSKPRDEGALLDLMYEERAIVRQALGLKPEKRE